ncbi:MAG: glycoside hydrolase family 3 N-terminal domain-containing protein [Boseongicola sp.]
MANAGAYILAPAGSNLTRREAAFFQDADPWGFIVFQRNCVDPAQLRKLTAELRDAVGRAAPVLIDQEGGRVQRMRAPHWREWLPPLDQTQLMASSGSGDRSMYLRGLLIGAELLDHGIDVNCAPSADIAWSETHTFLRNRCYGSDATTVTRMARACVEGLLDAGCLPVIKHAPGHGRAVSDSHKSLPRIDAPLAQLKDEDFAPFRALSDLPMFMTAHIVLPEIDPVTPITQSTAGVSLLREKLGLSGLLMTDDISMGALSGKIPDRAAQALGAGCDLVLHCNGDLTEMEMLASAAGQLSPRASKMADIALRARRTPTDIDISACEAEFKTLIEGAENA